jgi:hypothetical protein
VIAAVLPGGPVDHLSFGSDRGMVTGAVTFEDHHRE